MSEEGLSFDPRDVAEMFSEMSATYGAMNLCSSFGFSHIWRHRCVRAAEIAPGHRVADLMAGMGEASSLVSRETRGEAEIMAVDFCPEMCERAERSSARRSGGGFSVRCEDVLQCDFEGSFDRILCTFGIKTLAPEAQRKFARRMAELLRPGGVASMVEISVPRHPLLLVPYRAYLRWGIPQLGRLFLGDPDCYRNLSRYTTAFAAEDRFSKILEEAGLHAEEKALFWGCAKLYVARRIG